jgi:hypothetical protein|tara:strand:+ start:545 stop:784 length:240 start_codon:yes stop_codon:yes gene_type:complete
MQLRLVFSAPHVPELFLISRTPTPMIYLFRNHVRSTILTRFLRKYHWAVPLADVTVTTGTAIFGYFPCIAADDSVKNTD